MTSFPKLPRTKPLYALVEQAAEAYAIAEEAQKTLQQARDAVAKARNRLGLLSSGENLGRRNSKAALARRDQESLDKPNAKTYHALLADG